MRTQKFGIEIEMTGITREKAAKVIAEYFGTESFYIALQPINFALQKSDALSS